MLLPLFDPPRHDTKETIEKCIEKGIQVKMVTGDQLLIGKETAKQLGMGTNMYTTEVLMAVTDSFTGRGHLIVICLTMAMMLVSYCVKSCQAAV